jgi:hypothetical protein
MKRLIVLSSILLFSILNVKAQTCLPDGINFTAQSQIDSFPINYPGCIIIEGFVLIGAENGWDDIDIANLDSLISIISIVEYLKFWNNDPLSDFTGLNNLLSIGGGLLIESNSSLENLNGLENLSSIGGEMKISANNYMSSADGVDNLTTIGGNLSVENNNALPEITGLESLESVDGDVIINSNFSLTSLSGLDNLDPNIIDMLSITSNASLTECAIQSVCDYFNQANFSILIFNNGTGCANINEVEDACIPLSIEENKEGFSVNIYPNPANERIFISGDQKMDNISIYNQVGQKMLEELNPNGVVDISTLISGIYIVELHFGNSKMRKKLVVE